MTTPSHDDQSFRRLLAGLDQPVDPPHELATRLRLRVLAEAELDSSANARWSAPAPAPLPTPLPSPAPALARPALAVQPPLDQPRRARPASAPDPDELTRRRRQPWWQVALGAAAGLLLVLGAAVAIIRLTVDTERSAPRLGSAVMAVASPTSDPAILWEREDPDLDGTSEVASDDETIVRTLQQMHKSGFLFWEKFEYEYFVQSIDRATGELNWLVPFDGFGTPQITDAAIIVVNYGPGDGTNPTLVGLEHADGSQLWEAELPDFPVVSGNFPVIGDVAYISTHGGSGPGPVRAIDLSSGAEVWTTRIGEFANDTGRDPYGVPSTLTVRDGRLFMLDLNGGVAEIDPLSGATVATIAATVPLTEQEVYSGQVFVTDDRLVTMVAGMVEAYDPEVAAEPDYFIRVSATDRATGAASWSKEFDQNVSLVTQVDDYLLVWLYDTYDEATGEQPSTIRVLDIRTGAEVWTQPQASFTSVSLQSATVTDGQLLYGTPDGQVVSLDVATGAELWRFKVGDSLTMPPVVSGSIAITSDRTDRLVAIAIPERQP